MPRCDYNSATNNFASNNVTANLNSATINHTSAIHHNTSSIDHGTTNYTVTIKYYPREDYFVNRCVNYFGCYHF